jgi:outer membrane scaffolding protein for murein synthesis (MipA/OmpV family)
MTFPTRTTLATLGLLTLSGAALAQSIPAGDSLTLAAGAAVGRDYTGGGDERVRPALLFDYQRADGFFVSLVRGLGYAEQVGMFTLSAALAYDGGRSDSRQTFRQGSDALRGMGDIDGGAAARFGVSTRVFGHTTLSLDADLALSRRERGDTLRFGLQQELWAGGADKVALALSTTYGDSKHAHTWFGVSAAQSASSGYAAYAPGAGIEQSNAELSWGHRIDGHWSLRAAAGALHLSGDAADSPITQKRTYPVGVVTVNYGF